MNKTTCTNTETDGSKNYFVFQESVPDTSPEQSLCQMSASALLSPLKQSKGTDNHSSTTEISRMRVAMWRLTQGIEAK